MQHDLAPVPLPPPCTTTPCTTTPTVASQEQDTTQRLAVAMVADMNVGGRDRLAVKRTKGGRYLAEITKEELLQFQHLPIETAADKLGVGTTSLKIRCREVGIKKWPFRDIQRAVAKVARSKMRENQRAQQQQQQHPHVNHHHYALSKRQVSMMPHPDSRPSSGMSGDALRGALNRLITPAVRTPSPDAAQHATSAFLNMQQQFGEQATLQMLFDQYGNALASMPPELAGMLGMHGVDSTAVIRCVQEFAVQTIANVLTHAHDGGAATHGHLHEGMMLIPATQPPPPPQSSEPPLLRTMMQPVHAMQQEPPPAPAPEPLDLTAASSLPSPIPAMAAVSPVRALQQVQLSLDSLFGAPATSSGIRDCSLHNDVFQAAINQLSMCGDLSLSGDFHTFMSGTTADAARGGL